MKVDNFEISKGEETIRENPLTPGLVVDCEVADGGKFIDRSEVAEDPPGPIGVFDVQDVNLRVEPEWENVSLASVSRRALTVLNFGRNYDTGDEMC